MYVNAPMRNEEVLRLRARREKPLLTSRSESHSFSPAPRHATLSAQVHFKSEITEGARRWRRRLESRSFPLWSRRAAMEIYIYGGSRALRNEMRPFITISPKWLPRAAERKAQNTPCSSARPQKGLENLTRVQDFIEPLTKLVALMLQIESALSKSRMGVELLFSSGHSLLLRSWKEKNLHTLRNMQKVVLIVFDFDYILRQPRDREAAFANWTFSKGWRKLFHRSWRIVPQMEIHRKRAALSLEIRRRVCCFPSDEFANIIIACQLRREMSTAAALVDYRRELWMQNNYKGRPSRIKRRPLR